MKKQFMMTLTVVLVIFSLISNTFNQNENMNESFQEGLFNQNTILNEIFQHIIHRIQSFDLNQLFSRFSSFLDGDTDEIKTTIEPLDDRTDNIKIFKDDNLEENEWIYPGEFINYSISYQNSECCQYTNVMIREYIPEDVNIIDASHPYQISNNVFTWYLGTVEPNEQQDRWILVQLSPSIQPGIQLNNLVKIFVGTVEHDSASTQTTVGAPQIHLQKSDCINETEYINPNEYISYNITFENPTGYTYSDVIIRDVLPENVTFVNSSHTCNNPDGFVHWNIGTIQPYEIVTIWMNVSVDNDAPTGGQITNIAYLNYTLGSTSGSVQATETTLIGTPYYEPLSIIKNDNCLNDAIPPEGLVNYTIIVHNPNLINVYNVWITDYLPEDVIYLGSSQENFVEYYQHIADWFYPILGPNETKIIWLKVQANESLNPGDSFINIVKSKSDQTVETTTSETTLINEIFPPVTTLTIGSPSVDNQWVTTKTPIILHATDDAAEGQSGVKYIYYKIEWNDAIYEYEIWDNTADDYNRTIGIVEARFHFDETCLHELTYYAVDNTGTIESKHTKCFYVDDTPPDLNNYYSGFYDPYFFKYGGNWYTGIARTTLINLIATGSGSNNDNGCNGGVGFDHLGYRWYAGDEMDDLEKIVDTIVYDPSVSIDLFMSLWHRIEYYTEDKLENNNPGNDSYKSIDLLIDDIGPTCTSYFEGPFYEDTSGIDWITSKTKKIIEATDSGGIPDGSGVQRIEWHIDQKLRGEWTTVQEGTVYDNDNEDTDGTPASPKNGDEGGLYAYDYKGEPFIFQDINNNWSYDPGEPILDLDPDGDGFIEKYIADPTAGDRGGLWAMDEKNEPFIFQDINKTWRYDVNDTIIDLDPDGDDHIVGEWIPKYTADPKYGDRGGLYAYDNDDEIYIFEDSADNSEWTFDKWWDEENSIWMNEPIITLKPDYDGKGTIQMNMSIPEDGEHRFYYQAFDRFGNRGIEKNQYVRVDNTPPDSFIDTGDPFCSYYTIQDEEIICATTYSRLTLQTTDKTYPCNVGIDTLHYSIIKNGIIVMEDEIPQDEFYFYFDTYGQGSYNVTWFATDLLGNTEPIKYQKYCIDDTPPSVDITIENPKIPGSSHEPDYWITKETEVTVTVTQSGCCPILNTRFRLNKGSWHYLSESSALIPSSFFDIEQRYEIEIEADNCYLPAVITRKVVYVDNSPPDISVMNPSDGGYYAEDDLISSVVFVEDLPLHPPLAEPVGISQGMAGNAVLIDIYPDFTILPLMNIDFIFDPEAEGSPFFQGDFKIIGSEGVLNNGPVLFVVEIEDDLGNYQNSILDILYDYYEDAYGDEYLFKSLVNADDGINSNIAWINIDQDYGDDDDDVPVGTVESVSFLSPVDDNDVEEDTIDIRLVTTGDADPSEVDVEVVITIEGYAEITKTADYDESSERYQILDYDISFLENNSIVSFHGIATDNSGNEVETDDDPTIIIKNTVYFSKYLETGWNTVEFDEIIGDADVETVFESILEENDVTVIFEEETGDYYIPSQTYNPLEEVDIDNTYKIKMKNDAPLYLSE